MATAAPAAAQDPVPIGPNQFFSGFVNNAPPGPAVIKVICPGIANTGHPLANQPVEVKPAPGTSTTDTGYTGSVGDQITASLTTITATVLIAHFTSYFVPVDIPVGITVPCSGSGTMIFVPGPNSPTARSAVLPVKFVNIAG
jgi:hypothetical protein